MLRVGMNGFGSASVLGLEEAPIPTPKAKEVLIEVHAAGVNRPDIAQREGRYPAPPGASPTLGLEVAGTVVAVGSGAEWAIGDHVLALAPGGGYAEYCVVPAGQCLLVPRGLSMVEAAGVPETFFTVWANVFQIGKLQGGETFLVHGGTSGIGTTAIQLANAFGATVLATAGTDEKCAACLRLGANAAINYRTTSFVDEVARLTQGRGANLILDMIAGDYVEKNLKSLAMDGRLVQIAAQHGASVSLNVFAIMQKRATITGSMLRPRSVEDKASMARDLEEHVWPLLEAGKVKVVVDRVFPFAEVRQAHEYLERGEHIGKVILKVR